MLLKGFKSQGCCQGTNSALSDWDKEMAGTSLPKKSPVWAGRLETSLAALIRIDATFADNLF